MLLKGFTNLEIIASKKYTIYLYFFVYSLILLLFCSGFSPLYSFNIWCDVNVYYTIGKGIVFGKIPYRDLFDHKGPVIFFIYALGYLMSPNSFFGMFIIQTFSLSISLFCIFYISNLFLDRRVSLFISSIFPFFLFFFTFIGGSAEEFILTMMFVSLYFFMIYFHENRTAHKPSVMFLHGVLIGLVFFIKANLIIFWIFPVSTILYLQLRYNISLFLRNICLLFIGFLFISSSISIYFLSNNAFSDFINAYFILNIKYSSIPYTGIKNYILGIIYNAFVVFNLEKISFLISLLGVSFFVLSKVFIKKKIFRLSLFLTFISTSVVLFSIPTLMQYYFTISCIFIPFGMVSGCKLLGIYRVFQNKYLSYFLCFCSFVLVIYSRSYFTSLCNIDRGDIFEEDKKILYLSSEMITKNVDQTLLSIGLDLGVDVFTVSNNLPNVRYFFTPNVIIDKAQYLYDQQKNYIKEGFTNFLIMNNSYRYKYFFESEINMYYRPVLKEGDYTLYQRL